MDKLQSSLTPVKLALRMTCTLTKVLHIPSFKHNLISVTKLTQESNCKAIFHPHYYVIQHISTHVVKGIGKVVKGLYYLLNELVCTLTSLKHSKNITKPSSLTNTTIIFPKKALTAATSCTNIPTNLTQVPTLSTPTLWHHRLEHAPMSKIEKIDEIHMGKHSDSEVCLTCPLSKFTKLPYLVSQSKASL